MTKNTPDAIIKLRIRVCKRIGIQRSARGHYKFLRNHIKKSLIKYIIEKKIIPYVIHKIDFHFFGLIIFFRGT